MYKSFWPLQIYLSSSDTPRATQFGLVSVIWTPCFPSLNYNWTLNFLNLFILWCLHLNFSRSSSTRLFLWRCWSVCLSDFLSLLTLKPHLLPYCLWDCTLCLGHQFITKSFTSNRIEFGDFKLLCVCFKVSLLLVRFWYSKSILVWLLNLNLNLGILHQRIQTL